jgi:hypothetical protein
MPLLTKNEIFDLQLIDRSHLGKLRDDLQRRECRDQRLEYQLMKLVQAQK